MSTEFRMPSLGADMESGVLVEWRVPPGQSFRRGDVVALVETDKGIIDVEAFHDGLVEEVLTTPGTRLAVGEPMARLAGAAPETPATPATPVATAATPARPRVSPAARARARAAGIDPAALKGSGPGGTVTLADVRPPAALSTMARAMARAKREIPHYYVFLTMDLQPAMDWLQQRNMPLPVEQRVLPIALLVKAVALAARDVPGFNGYFRDNSYQPATDINVGIAIAQRKGPLVSPALCNVPALSLDVVMQGVGELVRRTRTGHLSSSSLTSATITVSSLGENGVDSVAPIIHPDQVAIVGFGAPCQRPWVVDGKLCARSVLSVTLAADHRVSDGHMGARLLGAIRDYLTTPERL